MASTRTADSVAVALATRDRARDVHRALHALIWDLPPSVTDVFIVTPHEENDAVIGELQGSSCRVHHLYDQQQGKPAALNHALRATTAGIIVITDGDVVVEPGAVAKLLSAFEDPRVGAATGRPAPLHDRVPRGRYAYWGKVLLAEADRVRARAAGRSAAAARGNPAAPQLAAIECSGYLYAFRRALLPIFPEQVLVEDAYVSGVVLRTGWRVAYVRDAVVRVRPPASWRDWHAQKLRAMVGSQQALLRELPRMRRFGQEASALPGLALRYVRSVREFLWLLALVVARLIVWTHATMRIHLRALDPLDYWHPILTTKSRPPVPGDIHMVSGWALPVGVPTAGRGHRCVVLEVESAGGVRVAIVGGDRAAGPNPSDLGPPALPFTLLIGENDLGSATGQCSNETLARLLSHLR